MGKKGVLLDNGKVAQSSMALYWKAGQKKSAHSADRAGAQPKEEDMETRVGSAMQRWKQHKEKMISKLYAKPEKKEQSEQKLQAERQQRIEEEMQRELLEKQLNKNKPIHIPGFKDPTHLQGKRQYEKVVAPNQDTNKLILPAGFEDLSQEDIVQMLREKKAKKELAKAQRQRDERASRVMEMQYDLLANRPEQKLQPKEEPAEKAEENKEQGSIFKSELLQKIERGEHIVKKQNAEASVAQTPQEQPKPIPSKFIPRALWNK